MRDYLPIVYATYLVTAVGLCSWLARTLFRNGAVFLADVFADRPELAQAVNRLLVTGFAMFNLGYAFFLLQGGVAADATEAFEVLARKLGVLLVSLAVVHFVNIAAFHWINGRRRQATMVPPVAPQRRVEPPAGGGPWGHPLPPPPAAPRPAPVP
ncbi:hypothetical protein KSP35_09635 [Aquihabitans sp. G128]|uniref:hypothetical protein n=1 Tax=Aquihabitans sp. G128 TaxID=2849779 RepID=UPI001C20FC48|nr:hypothetical protein [Aquihabitans sp. G128]QXC63013.1 hypothetical protein KSP35_09635 [Aquihabitans sp. G128]